MIDFICRADF